MSGVSKESAINYAKTLLLYLETERTYQNKIILVPPVSATYADFFSGVHFRASVILQGQIFLCHISRPTMKANEREIHVYVVLHSTRSGILARKNSRVLNWNSFLDHEYSFFNAIGSHLIA